MMQTYCPTGFFYLFVTDIPVIIDQIFPYRPLEQPGILQYHTKLSMHCLPGHLCCGNSINPNTAALNFMKAHQQIHHCGFPRTCRAYDGYFLTGFCPGGKIMNDDRIGILISEPDMLKFHIPLYRFGQSRLTALIFHFLRFQKFKHALPGSCGGLKRLYRLCDLGQRLCKITDIHHKCHNNAKTDSSVQRHCSANNTHRHIAQVTDKSHDGHHKSRQTLGLKTAFAQISVHPVKDFLGFLLTVISFYHCMPGIDFLDVPVDLTKVLLLSGKVFLAPAHNGEHYHKSQKTGGHCGQSHPSVRDEHHAQTPEKENKGGNQISDAVIQRLADGIHIIGHAGQYIAGGGTIIKPHGQSVYLPGNIRTHFLGYTLCNCGHNPPLYGGENITQHIQGNQCGADGKNPVHING